MAFEFWPEPAPEDPAEAIRWAEEQFRRLSGALQLDSAWNRKVLSLGTYRIWVDATGDLRIKDGEPTSDTDGTVVGTQT